MQHFPGRSPLWTASSTPPAISSAGQDDNASNLCDLDSDVLAMYQLVPLHLAWDLIWETYVSSRMLRHGHLPPFFPAFKRASSRPSPRLARRHPPAPDCPARSPDLVWPPALCDRFPCMACAPTPPPCRLHTGHLSNHAMTIHAKQSFDVLPSASRTAYQRFISTFTPFLVGPYVSRVLRCWIGFAVAGCRGCESCRVPAPSPTRLRIFPSRSRPRDESTIRPPYDIQHHIDSGTSWTRAPYGWATSNLVASPFVTPWTRVDSIKTTGRPSYNILRQNDSKMTSCDTRALSTAGHSANLAVSSSVPLFADKGPQRRPILDHRLAVLTKLDPPPCAKYIFFVFGYPRPLCSPLLRAALRSRPHTHFCAHDDGSAYPLRATRHYALRTACSVTYPYSAGIPASRAMIHAAR
ncbi:hypothetical protein B0H13DRAFT_2338541 [Mycena leptocephala]|nr:hypothetical protein B0H13DRAFT_2338541 [Mycena leptocephala]